MPRKDRNSTKLDMARRLAKTYGPAGALAACREREVLLGFQAWSWLQWQANKGRIASVAGWLLGWLKWW